MAERRHLLAVDHHGLGLPQIIEGLRELGALLGILAGQMRHPAIELHKRWLQGFPVLERGLAHHDQFVTIPGPRDEQGDGWPRARGEMQVSAANRQVVLRELAYEIFALTFGHEVGESDITFARSADLVETRIGVKENPLAGEPCVGHGGG